MTHEDLESRLSEKDVDRILKRNRGRKRRRLLGILVPPFAQYIPRIEAKKLLKENDAVRNHFDEQDWEQEYLERILAHSFIEHKNYLTHARIADGGDWAISIGSLTAQFAGIVIPYGWAYSILDDWVGLERGTYKKPFLDLLEKDDQGYHLEQQQQRKQQLERKILGVKQMLSVIYAVGKGITAKRSDRELNIQTGSKRDDLIRWEKRWINKLPYISDILDLCTQRYIKTARAVITEHAALRILNGDYDRKKLLS